LACDSTRRKQRSPSYPAIGLEAAIQRARTLYQQEGCNSAPVEAVLGHWGYSPKSGAGLVTLAALKKFGLLVDEGSGAQRKAKVSPLALKIILDDREESPERDEAIRQAALAPAIHKELWEKYNGNLLSDATMRHFLRMDKSFTDSAADELIREFRETASFAKLTVSDSLTNRGVDTGDQGDGEGEPGVTTLLPEAPAKPGQRPQQRAVQLPLSATEWVTLQAAFPLSAFAWQQMLRVLEAMKPGLVASDEKDREEAEE
jgi:hypothetical protein